MSDALYEFAHKMDKNTSVTRAYCDIMAYAGTSDSNIYKELPQSEQNRIQEIVEGERGNENISPNYNQKGKPCQ